MYILVPSYVTHLIFLLKAIKGHDLPQSNHDSRVRENSEVVIIYPEMYIYIYTYIPVVPHKAVAEVSKIGNL